MSKYRIFFGTYSKGSGNGVFCGEFDSENAEIFLNDTIDIENPSYLQLSPLNDNILYGVSETSEFENENGGALFSLDISEFKQMKLIDIKGTHGKHPCHLCIIENHIFVSNYSEGSLSIFETDKNGKIKPSCRSIHHFGKSVNPHRQEKPHIHFSALFLGAYLAVCDLGMDKIFLYPYFNNPHRSYVGLITDADIIECPPGAGPRHLAVSQNHRYLYVLTELSNTVLVYETIGGDNNGVVKLLQEISALPEDFTGRSTAAAIHISPDGKFLAASNRGHDSIAVFKIQENGELIFSSHIMTGKEPRDFRFSPDGKWLLSANQNDNSVTVYKIENDTFTYTSSISLPKPVCILFGTQQS